jgi:hypothetical protein
LRALLRILFVVPLSYIAACLSAGAFIVLAVFAAEGDAVVLPAGGGFAEIGFLAFSAAVAVATFSLLPALAFQEDDGDYAGFGGGVRLARGRLDGVKRFVVPGLTGSAPLKARRQQARSRPSRSSSASLPAHSSYAKLGAAEIVPRNR